VAGSYNLKVDIGDSYNAERSLKRFKRMCESYGIVREYKNRKEFKKPCVKAKEKREAAEKRRRKNSFRSTRYSSF